VFRIIEPPQATTVPFAHPEGRSSGHPGRQLLGDRLGPGLLVDHKTVPKASLQAGFSRSMLHKALAHYFLS
jgi:hypothetical protein